MNQASTNGVYAYLSQETRLESNMLVKVGDLQLQTTVENC